MAKFIVLVPSRYPTHFSWTGNILWDKPEAFSSLLVTTHNAFFHFVHCSLCASLASVPVGENYSLA